MWARPWVRIPSCCAYARKVAPRKRFLLHEVLPTFSLAFLGDCKSITIQRRGELCYREYGGTYYFKQEDKTFYAKDYNGSHQFTWKMHFDDGDNEIPVIVEDNHGNRASYKVIVRARFVRNNAPQINIDNNIENNIYE